MSISENQHQMTVFKWTQQPSVRRKWPELKLLFHIPNERICDPRYGKKLRLMGVRRGVPDLCLPVARGQYSALFLEMKSEEGATSTEQDWWIDELLKAGCFVEVCHGYESAIRVLEWYMSLPAGGTYERTG